MPVKIKGLQEYYVPTPECSLDGLFNECLNLFPAKASSADQAAWVRQNSNGMERLNLFYHQRESNSVYWRNGFLTCDVLFETHAPLSPPLIIFKFDYCHPIHYPRKLWGDESIELVQAALDEDKPLKWGRETLFTAAYKLKYVTAYLFGNQLWTLTKEEGLANEEQLRLLFLEAVDKERTKFERLRRKFSGDAGARVESRREIIPEEVRIFVWRRDEGRCIQCGSQARLEFDHIIPVSKGGSNTARNIQLLCEVCNRTKSNTI